MLCPFRIKEKINYGTLKEQVFQTCLRYDCPAYRYKQISDVTYKDVCLRLVDYDDKFYKEDNLHSPLIVSDAVKNGIKGTKLADMSHQDSSEYRDLVKEANENIKKAQREQAEALVKARDYISD